MYRTAILLAAYAAFAMPAIAQNTAAIDQAGTGNAAGITQTGTTNDASIEQLANASAATQTQDGSGHVATIKQQGWDWGAGAPGAAVGASAYQYQVGTDHEADILQNPDAGYGGSLASQRQGGDGQYARIAQGAWNSAGYQNQTGAGNVAGLWQYGINNESVQNQAGTANYSYVDDQKGGWSGAGNSALTDQVGDFNHALIGQPGGNGNVAEIVQTGVDNRAGHGMGSGGDYGIFQDGDFNQGYVAQDLNANWSKLYQIGNDNFADVSQAGSTGFQPNTGWVNVSDISQTGDANTATVVQNH